VQGRQKAVVSGLGWTGCRRPAGPRAGPARPARGRASSASAPGPVQLTLIAWIEASTSSHWPWAIAARARHSSICWSMRGFRQRINRGHGTAGPGPRPGTGNFAQDRMAVILAQSKARGQQGQTSAARCQSLRASARCRSAGSAGPGHDRVQLTRLAQGRVGPGLHGQPVIGPVALVADRGNAAGSGPGRSRWRSGPGGIGARRLRLRWPWRRHQANSGSQADAANAQPATALRHARPGHRCGPRPDRPGQVAAHFGIS
jgi:hypothetical protein